MSISDKCDTLFKTKPNRILNTKNVTFRKTSPRKRFKYKKSYKLTNQSQSVNTFIVL